MYVHTDKQPEDMTPEEKRAYDEAVEQMLRTRHFNRDTSLHNYAKTIRGLAEFVREMQDYYHDMRDDGVFPNPHDTPFHTIIPAALHRIAKGNEDAADGIPVALAADIKRFGPLEGPNKIKAAIAELRHAATSLPNIPGQSAAFDFAPPSKPVRKGHRKTAGAVNYADLIRRIAGWLRELNGCYLSLRRRAAIPDIYNTPFHEGRDIPAGFADIADANDAIVAALRAQNREDGNGKTLADANEFFRLEIKYLPMRNDFVRMKDAAAKAKAKKEGRKS